MRINSVRDAVNVAGGSDSNTAPYVGFYVGVVGDVTVNTRSGTCLFKAVPAGTTIWVACNKIMATNTTASQIVGLIGALLAP